MTDEAQTADGDILEADEEQLTPAVADDVLPDALHLLPIPGRPFFPGQVQPVAIDPAEWGETLEAVAASGNRLIGLSHVAFILLRFHFNL